MVLALKWGDTVGADGKPSEQSCLSRRGYGNNQLINKEEESPRVQGTVRGQGGKRS